MRIQVILQKILNIIKKKFSDNLESSIDLSNEENNEEITKKIFDLLNNLNFIEYNENRRVDNIEKKLNNLRNIQETIYTNTYEIPSHFYYPLFKSNLLGAKVGLIADVEFMPMNGKFYTKMLFDANGIIIPVF